MKLLEGTHVMLDLETYDTATTAVILSIGAVKFTKETIIDTFYVNVESVLPSHHASMIMPGHYEVENINRIKINR
jgi:DNA polymerase III epsilon subunit-like protein